jgi:hypothetical protein
MSRIKQTLQEPLVHFLLIGAALFLMFRFTTGPAGDGPDRIVVTPVQVEQLEARFSRTWMRPPTQEEMDGLIESHVRDEVYYREAAAMGLDRDDPTIRQRMRMKLEFLLEDLSVVGEASDQALTEFLQQHPGKFRVEPRVSFRQIYLDPGRHQDLTAEARDLLKKLNQGAVPEEAGDRTLLEYEYVQAWQGDITQSFGEAFALEVVVLEPGKWAGPFYSQFGGHLVMVKERTDARLPELAEIRHQVEREYLALRRQELKDDTYQKLRAGYEVVIEPPATAEDRSGEAIAASRPEEAGQ